MAYTSDPIVEPYDSAGTSSSGTNPTHVSGDYLLMCAIGRSASASFVAPTQDGGWTQVGSEVNQGSLSVAWFYIKATGSSMANPSTSHASTQYRAILVWNIGDGDPTTFIDTSFGTSGVASAYSSDTSTTGLTCASGTTSANDCLIMHVAVCDAFRNLDIMPLSMRNLNTIDIGANLQVTASWVFQETAGTTPTWTIHQTRQINDALSVCIAIRSDAPIRPARHDSSAPQAEILYATQQSSNAGIPATDTAIASDLGSIDSITTNDASFSDITGASFNPYWTVRMLSSSTADQIATQHYLRSSATDCTGDKISLGIMLDGGQSLSRLKGIANHGVMVGLTSGVAPSKEIAMYDAGGFETSPIEVQSIVVDSSTSKVKEVNTFDISDVRGFVIGAHLAVGSNTRMGLDYVHRLDTIKVIGGASSRPASWATAYQAARSASAKTISKLGSTYQSKQDIQIGAGSSGADVNWDDTGESFSTPAVGSVADGNLEFQAANVDVTIDVSAGSTVNFTSAISGQGTLDFTLASGSASGATYAFSGSMDEPRSVTLNPVKADILDGYTFKNFPEITHNDTDLTGVTFDGCTGTQAITITGATEAALQTAINRLDQCTFTNSGTYGLKIYFTGTGNVSLNAPTGLSVDELLYESDNSSALTIVVGSSGASFPSTNTAGSATGVTISNDKTLTLNIVDESGSAVSGCEVGILERGTTTEVDHDNNTASGTYTYTYTYSSDTNIDIQVLKQGYEPYWDDTQTLGNADQSITVVLMSVPASQN